MKCPFCDNDDTRVIDSRPTDEGQAIRRRRVCDKCGKRFTTYEKVEEIMFMVVKKDGSREMFDKSKVRNGIVNACKKRPVNAESDRKDRSGCRARSYKYDGKGDHEHGDRRGNTCQRHLRTLDEVAYVRFASVYRQYEDVSTFIKEINDLLGNSSGQETG